MASFHVTYTLTDGETGSGTLTGPKDASESDCERIIKLVASNYSIDADSVQVAKMERTSKGFLHPLESLLPDGRTATVSRWYF